MINRNSAESAENSVAAVNNGSGNQEVDNSTRNYYLRGFVNLAETAIGKIVFDPSQVREVVLMIHDSFERPDIESSKDFLAVDVEKKNEINGLTQDFYDEHISINFEPFFYELEAFLKKRENEDLQLRVLEIASNLNKKISIKRKNFETFEELLCDVEDALLEAQYDHLKGKESIISLFVYYLYANCLIGKKVAGE